MPRPPAARSKVIAAFVEILIDEGERAATVEAVAARAGVSKGGLLYHFGSKDALVDGLLEALADASAADVAAMRSAPEGPVSYYLRTSGTSDDQLTALYVAATRLTQQHGQRAGEQLVAIENGWYQLLLNEIGDPLRARMVLLLGDGLYLHSVVGSQAQQTPPETEELIRAVNELIIGRTQSD